MKVVFDRKFHQMNCRRNLLFFSNDHLLSKSIDFNNEKGQPIRVVQGTSQHTSISSI